MLGVDTTASPAQVREAFRRRAREVHPDTSGGDADAMVELNDAYETLAATAGPDWDFATAMPNEPTVSWADEPIPDAFELQARDSSLLRWFGIALVVASVVMTTVVFVVAIGYDWSLSSWR